MSSVVERIEEIQKIDGLKQPRGGYLKPSLFTKTQLNNEKQLYNEENISPALVGTVVDYLTRYVYASQFCVRREDDDYVECGMEIFDDVFGSVFIAAKIAEKIMKKDYTESTDSISAKFCEMTVFSNPISELTDEFIILATKFISLDAFRRNPMSAILSAKIDAINPDYKTIHNIRVMVERSINFFNIYGPITKFEFVFNENGYTSTVNCGDGDFLTEEILWDFKTIKGNITSKHTLQILMYYIMGKHSKMKVYENINKIGIYNPRKNIVYTYNVTNIPKETITFIEDNVICYE